jgi:chloride channel protein, CIC family
LVIDKDQLYGMVTLSDLERAITADQIDRTVADFCTRNVVTAFPDETLDDALRQFGALDVGRMPVVERRNRKHVLGLLRRGDIVHALSGKVASVQQSSHHMDRLKMEAVAKTDLKELFVARADAACGKALKEIPIPEDCVIVSIQRGRQVVIPRGVTQLIAGDRLIALVGEGSLGKLQLALREGNQPSPSSNGDLTHPNPSS